MLSEEGGGRLGRGRRGEERACTDRAQGVGGDGKLPDAGPEEAVI